MTIPYDKDQLATKTDLAVLDCHLAILEARLGMIERVLWGIVIGVAALLVRAYLATPGGLRVKQ